MWRLKVLMLAVFAILQGSCAGEPFQACGLTAPLGQQSCSKLPVPSDDATISENDAGLNPGTTGEDTVESGSEKEPLKEGKLILLVKTACELQAAVLGGAEHIEIGEHMDLTGLDLIDDHLLGPVPPTLKTIRGQCYGPAPTAETLESRGIHPPFVPLRPLRPAQCLLLVNHNLLVLGASSLLLRGIYVRVTTPRDGPFNALVSTQSSSASMWMMDVTLQGNGDGHRDCADCGLSIVPDSRVFSQDNIFADFDGHRVIHNQGKLNLVRCTFEGNNLGCDTSGCRVVCNRPLVNYGMVGMERCWFSDDHFTAPADWGAAFDHPDPFNDNNPDPFGDKRRLAKRRKEEAQEGAAVEADQTHTCTAHGTTDAAKGSCDGPTNVVVESQSTTQATTAPEPEMAIDDTDSHKSEKGKSETSRLQTALHSLQVVEKALKRIRNSFAQN